MTWYDNLSMGFHRCPVFVLIICKKSVFEGVTDLLFVQM